MQYTGVADLGEAVAAGATGRDLGGRAEQSKDKESGVVCECW